ncbi:hypothetical protein BD779DRAFT_1694628, partial [Infundibulicybe gibba]
AYRYGASAGLGEARPAALRAFAGFGSRRRGAECIEARSQVSVAGDRGRQHGLVCWAGYQKQWVVGGEIGEAAGNTMSCGGWATGLSSANIIHVVGNCVWVAAHIITTIVRADVRLREYARLTAAKTRTKTAACLVPESNGVWAEPPALRQSHSERHRAGQFAGRIKHGNLLFLELSPSLDWIQSGVVFIMGLGDNSIGDTLQCRRRADWIDTGHACLAAGSTSGVIRVSSKRHYQWHPPYHIMNKIAGLAPAQPKIMMLCPAPQSNCH